MTNPLEQVAEETVHSASTSDPEAERRVAAALNCPCVSEIKSSPCGADFTEAFSCYLRSRAEVQGQDCVETYMALHR